MLCCKDRIRSTKETNETRLRYLRRDIDSDAHITGCEKIELSGFKDSLTSHISGELLPLVKEFIDSNNAVCDREDLRKQVLFRLLTFDTRDIFNNGAELDEYLRETGIYSDWHAIPLVQDGMLAGYRLNGRLVNRLLSEQYRNIRTRIERSAIRLDDLIKAHGIFDEPDWYIRREDGRICASHSDGRTVPIEFREVDSKYASSLFNDMHYLHAPRVDIAFGLFLNGGDMPFSVQGVCRIDRNYKRDALSLRGYDAENCWEFTRLYNRSGSPMFTSSFIMGNTVRHLKRSFPRTEACITTISPSLENGRSMVGGGFGSILLAKPERLMFARDEGLPEIRRITQRQLSDGQEITHNRIPILPRLVMARYVSKQRNTPSIAEDEVPIVE